ncbi:MAG TPA: hypothetical protein VJ824_03375 [Bacillota bacterium]|nr:hypothetical protein [Bacillota bacterium]
MQYRLWLFMNGLFIAIIFFYIWVVRPHDNSLVTFGQLLAQIAVILFFINVNMHFIFKVIKKSNQRNVKILLANISRRMMKWHIPTAVGGTLIILGHAGIMISRLGADLVGSLKGVSGVITLLLLGVTLFAGYLRHTRASGFRRKFHLTMAMIFAVFILIHMFMYV